MLVSAEGLDWFNRFEKHGCRFRTLPSCLQKCITGYFKASGMPLPSDSCRTNLQMWCFSNSHYCWNSQISSMLGYLLFFLIQYEWKWVDSFNNIEVWQLVIMFYRLTKLPWAKTWTKHGRSLQNQYKLYVTLCHTSLSFLIGIIRVKCKLCNCSFQYHHIHPSASNILSYLYLL